MISKKFVKITNTSNGVQVFPDLRSINTTNYRSPTADRLKVKPAWTRFRVIIKKGTHWYPAEVAKWPSVQELEKIDYLTIGKETDDCDDANAKQLLQTLINAQKRYEADIAANKKIAEADKQLAKQITEDTYTA